MMYTSILAVALTGLSAPAESATVASWSQDYTSARKQAVAEKKPLAVFLAPGTRGWDKIGRDGGLSMEDMHSAQGSPLTIEELRSRYKDAFEKAGV